MCYPEFSSDLLDLVRTGGRSGVLGQGAAKIGWTLAVAGGQVAFGMRPCVVLRTWLLWLEFRFFSQFEGVALPAGAAFWGSGLLSRERHCLAR
jgi:hypothetical protein